MTTRAVAPSSVARTLAGALWPDVQSQTKLARGIYWLSCAGHGGAVAIIGEADLPADAIEAARATGKIELVAVLKHGRGTERHTTEKYTPESLRLWAQTHGADLYECWVGEEDCDWATLALVSEEMRAAMPAKLGYSEGTRGELQDAYDCCQRWNQDYLRALGYAVVEEVI